MKTKTVCFSVNLTAKEMRLGAGQAVIFDDVLINEGNGYDDRTGVFTCSVAGNYMLVVDSHSPGPTWLHLYLNEKMVATLYAFPSGSQNRFQMSRTVILKLKKRDHVKFVNHPTATGVVHHHRHSGFQELNLIDCFVSVFSRTIM